MVDDTSGRIFIYAIIGFFVGLAFIYNGLKRFLLVQKIKDTPTSKVDATPVGLVEINGKAICHDPTSSPVSGVDCAFWRVIGEYYQSGKYGGWRRIYTSDSRKQFYVEDDTGKMLIEPEGAEIDIPVDNKFEGYISGHGTFDIPHSTMDPRVIKFVDSLDFGPKSAFMEHMNQDIRVHEFFIADGDPLFVLGSAEPVEGASSDVNYENLIIRKGDMDKTMYVCDNGERAVISRLATWMYIHIFGGLILSAICLFIILGMIGI